MARVAILTASDKGAAGTRADESGVFLAEKLAKSGHEVVKTAIVPDERRQISDMLRDWCDGRIADFIITTGGTGLTARDVTPEATRDIAEREVPGIPVALTVNGLQHTPFAALSRGIAVTRGQTLIVNLPGGRKAVEQGLEVLIPMISHVADLLSGPVEH